MGSYKEKWTIMGEMGPWKIHRGGFMVGLHPHSRLQLALENDMQNKERCLKQDAPILWHGNGKGNLITRLHTDTNGKWTAHAKLPGQSLYGQDQTSPDTPSSHGYLHNIDCPQSRGYQNSYLSRTPNVQFTIVRLKMKHTSFTTAKMPREYGGVGKMVGVYTSCSEQSTYAERNEKQKRAQHTEANNLYHHHCSNLSCLEC